MKIENYHADNGRFADNEWMNEVRKSGQTISFSGVNAHWQNGVAERMIRTSRETGRKQLLHANERWPAACSTHLWPYALTYLAYLVNQLPNSKGEFPIMKFSSIDSVEGNMLNLHTFGCPVYVLNNKLQGGKQIPHWNPRARLGMYLGLSPRHAKNVSLVLNVNTGTVSPQFHIQHDEFFETIERGEYVIPAPWKVLAGFNKVATTAKKGTRENQETSFGNKHQDNMEIPMGDTLRQDEEVWETNAEEDQVEFETHTDENNDVETSGEQGVSEEPAQQSNTHTSTSRSGRVRKHTNKFQESIEQGL